MVQAHSDNEEQTLIRRVNNEIYLWGPITEEGMLDLIFEMDNAIQYIRKHSPIDWVEQKKDYIPLILRINSGGGDLIPTFAVIDKIKNLKEYKVISIVEGVAASAASLLSVSCHRRLITKSSYMLLHQLSGGMVGTYSNIKDNVIWYDMMNDAVEKIYKKHTTMTKEQIKEILSKDSWFNPNQCLELGLADEII